MSCTYTHSDLKNQSYKSVEELLYALKVLKGNKFYSSLVAYNFNKEEATKEVKSAKAFTKWYEEIIPNNRGAFDKSFESERGTFLHKYISTRLRNPGIPQDFTKEEENDIAKIINNPKFIVLDEWKDDSKWRTLCATVLNNIHNNINGEIVLIEEPIYYKKDDFNSVKATPDLVFKSKDGVYHVIDYKVTEADIENNVQYVAQLNFIESILKKHGAKNVVKENWVISPTTGGFSIKNKNKIASTNNTINNSLYNLFFDAKALNIDIDDEDVKKFEAIKEKVEKNRSNIMQNLSVYEEYLKQQVNKTKLTYFDGYTYNYTQSSSGEIILKRKGLQDIKFDNFEEFAKASFKYNQGKYTDAIENIINVLNNGQFNGVIENLDDKIKTAFQLNLGKYDNSIYTVVKLGDLTKKYGIVLIKHDDIYDIIKLSNVDMFDFNMGVHSNGLFSKALNDKIREGGTLLLDNFLPREITTQYEQSTPEATLGNIELFELFTAISLIKEKLGDDFKIGTIDVVSTINGNHIHTAQQFTQFENAFKILEANIKESELQSNEGLSFFTDYTRISREQLLLDNITFLLQDIGENWNSYDIDTESIHQKKRIIQDLIAEVENNPSKNMQLIIQDAIQLLTFLDQVTPNQIFEEVNYAVADAKNLFGVLYDALFNDNIRTVTASGQSVPGIGGGLKHTSSYQTPDEAVRKTNLKRDIIVNGFVQKTIEETAELKQATEKYLNYTKSNGFLGKFKNDELIYEPLFRHKDGKIDPEMVFKNPYVRDSQNTLTDEQRDYLEIVLFTINKQKNLPVIKNLTFAQLKTDSTKYQKYQEIVSNNERYLTVPLKLKKGFRGNVNRLGKAWTKSDIKSWWKDTVANLVSITDPNITTAQQLSEKRKARKDQKEIPSLYPSETNRIDLYQKHQPEEFILNLNLLCVDFVLDSLKRNALNQYLETVRTVGKYLTFTELATGINLSKQKEALINDTTINVFLDSISEEEFTQLITVSNAVKKVKSVVSLGFRPALFIKEEVLGLIKNFSHSIAKWIQSDNPITAKHITQAYKIVVPSNWYEDGLKKVLGVKSMADFSMIALLNQRWRIHGHDLSMYSEQLTVHKTIWNFDSGLAFANVTAPDNDNRMVIVVAKMLSDGTFNAFEIKDNQLIYNPSKDERFSYFFANRANDANMQTDKKYVQQKALYEYYITSFNDSGHSIAYSKNPKDWGMIPDPYTTQQLNSLKEQIGMMYGFYNHEERDQSSFGTYKRLYLQFMTWLPGELRRYFASGKESSVGKIAHLKDVEGNLLYWKRLDDGTRVKTTASTDENGNQRDPVYGWQAEPVVGLAICAAKVLHHGMKGDFQWFKEPNNKYFIRNAGLFLFNLIFGTIIAKIIASIWTNAKKDEDKYTTEAIMAIELGSKVFNELNFINNFTSATDSLNLISVNYMKDIFKDVSRSISSDDYSMFDFVNDNVSVLRDFHIND